MRLLLDSHALLWWLNDDTRLSLEARRAIADPESSVFVSAATVWEIAIKINAGKLRTPGPFDEALEASRFQTLPITARHALVAGQLPKVHGDPFDRMLIAQAQTESLTLVTRDRAIQEYGITFLPA